MRKRLSNYVLFCLAILILVYSAAVTHPNTVLARKACTSWSMVKNMVFTTSHPHHESSPTLPKGFSIAPGTAAEVPVLMYHYLTPKQYNKEPGNNSMINLEAFEQEMAYLHEQGYYTASLSELEQYVRGQMTLPAKSVVITFDDGYQNNYIYAYPILKSYGFKAAIFVIGSKIEEETQVFDPAKKTYLSKEEIKAAGDVFEFHSHTYDLHYKGFEKCGVAASAGLDSSLIQEDITKMKETVVDSPYFAYPFGEKSKQMIYELQENGYRMAFTVRQGFVKPGDRLMTLNRLTVTSNSDMKTLLNPTLSED
ncbi:MAG: polysaccharide deacetylase family protein [Paenibacillus sp.]|uniref:polysaccharide deacetylase family protein n=1 Tax=Paenibacillus sp. TaxID=58172 RepID=UPI00290D1D28|nr:polysaccharide deacetylase family protein [Paenibacillus sp.]MDU4697688.1 polysaccharide deacetylase family protein [Paenibacillus sp.]